MELIHAGNVPIENVVHQLFSDVGLKKLLGSHGAACFVLVRSGLAPHFHERLIENSETIDATTRNHIAFIVFHGDDSSVVRRPAEGWRAHEYHLSGLSTSNHAQIYLDEYHGDPIELSFDQEFANNLRYSSQPVPTKRIARAMDVATTALMERFDLPEQTLPCLLFVDASSINDAQLVQLSPQDPMESLYKDVLAPLGDEFKAFERYWNQRFRVRRTLDEHEDALNKLRPFEEKLKALEQKLQQERDNVEEARKTDSTKQNMLINELDMLRSQHTAYKKAEFEERLALVTSDSHLYAEAHAVKERLDGFEAQLAAARSQPFTEESRQTVQRLTTTVARVRAKLADVIGRHFVGVKDNIDRVERQIRRLGPTLEELEWKAKSLEDQIERFPRKKVDAEKVIKEFASFDLERERALENQFLKRLEELGYEEEFLKKEDPLAIQVVKAMVSHGRIGFSQIKREISQEKVKILFLAANPRKTTRLDLEEELRLIEIELKGSLYRDRIAFVARHAVGPDDLVRLVRAEKPTIIHFSGHGAPDGILLRDDGVEGYRIVHGESSASLLKDRGVQMVVLNACFSMAQAEPLSSSVQTIIGTTEEVGDEAARRFSVAFYRTLGDGYAVAEAFRDRGDSIALHNLKDVYKVIGRTDGHLVGPPMSL